MLRLITKIDFLNKCLVLKINNSAIKSNKQTKNNKKQLFVLAYYVYCTSQYLIKIIRMLQKLYSLSKITEKKLILLSQNYELIHTLI